MKSPLLELLDRVRVVDSSCTVFRYASVRKELQKLDEGDLIFIGYGDDSCKTKLFVDRKNSKVVIRKSAKTGQLELF